MAKFGQRSLTRIARLLMCTALAGCSAAWDKPGNPTDLNSDEAYMAERADMPAKVIEGKVSAERWNALEKALDYAQVLECRTLHHPTAGRRPGSQSRPVIRSDALVAWRSCAHHPARR